MWWGGRVRVNTEEVKDGVVGRKVKENTEEVEVSVVVRRVKGIPKR